MSDKIHVTKLNHFIKLFLYSIQNRDSFFFSNYELLRALYEWMYFLKKFDRNRFKKSKRFNEKFVHKEKNFHQWKNEISKFWKRLSDRLTLLYWISISSKIAIFRQKRDFWKFYFDLNVCLIFENSLMFEKYMWKSKISCENFVNVLFY